MPQQCTHMWGPWLISAWSGTNRGWCPRVERFTWWRQCILAVCKQQQKVELPIGADPYQLSELDPPGPTSGDTRP